METLEELIEQRQIIKAKIQAIEDERRAEKYKYLRAKEAEMVGKYYEIGDIVYRVRSVGTNRGIICDAINKMFLSVDFCQSYSAEDTFVECDKDSWDSAVETVIAALKEL